jgi:hypothetical protein
MPRPVTLIDDDSDNENYSTRSFSSISIDTASRSSDDDVDDDSVTGGDSVFEIDFSRIDQAILPEVEDRTIRMNLFSALVKTPTTFKFSLQCCDLKSIRFKRVNWSLMIYEVQFVDKDKYYSPSDLPNLFTKYNQSMNWSSYEWKRTLKIIRSMEEFDIGCIEIIDGPNISSTWTFTIK